MVPSGFKEHHPELVGRADGRWMVRCRQCETRRDQTTPIGIGVPIVNRFEAESISTNHNGARRPVAH